MGKEKNDLEGAELEFGNASFYLSTTTSYATQVVFSRGNIRYLQNSPAEKPTEPEKNKDVRWILRWLQKSMKKSSA